MPYIHKDGERGELAVVNRRSQTKKRIECTNLRVDGGGGVETHITFESVN